MKGGQNTTIIVCTVALHLHTQIKGEGRRLRAGTETCLGVTQGGPLVHAGGNDTNIHHGVRSRTSTSASHQPGPSLLEQLDHEYNNEYMPPCTGLSRSSRASRLDVTCLKHLLANVRGAMVPVSLSRIGCTCTTHMYALDHLDTWHLLPASV